MRIAARRWFFLSSLLLALPGAVRARTLKVFAAASLMESFQDIAARYERDNPGDKVELNFAGSQILSRQIQQGAPADVFASADQDKMDDLKKQGLAAEDKVFARNHLVVVACKEGKVGELKDVALPEVKVVLAGDNVPAGRYTAQVLAKMSKDALYGEGFQRRVQANTLSLETSVRSVLVKVVVGEADAGFVYATDAMTIQEKVRVIPIPDSLNQVASYPIAVMVKSAAPEEARKFVDSVLGEKGQALLKGRGFLPPR